MVIPIACTTGRARRVGSAVKAFAACLMIPMASMICLRMKIHAQK